MARSAIYISEHFTANHGIRYWSIYSKSTEFIQRKGQVIHTKGKEATEGDLQNTKRLEKC